MSMLTATRTDPDTSKTREPQSPVDHRVTWRIGALGVLAGVAVTLGLSVVAFRTMTPAPATVRIDSPVPPTSLVVVEVPAVTEPPPPTVDPAPVVVTSNLGERVTNLEGRVGVLESSSSQAAVEPAPPVTEPPSTTAPPTTVDAPLPN